ncbi:MAG: Zn-dependent protease [Candidatus Babeliales bacterium]
MDLIRSFTFIAQNFSYILLGLIGINFVVGFHELGHFLFCKLYNIRTPTFSLGFGPVLASKKIGTTNFALSAIPLGGYVEIAGSAELGQGEQKYAHDTGTDSFVRKPYYQKLLVMLGGILFNLMFAYFALVGFYWFGLPKSEFFYPRNAQPVINKIQEDSPAAKVHMQIGDRILAINDTHINDDALKAYKTIASMPGAPVTLKIQREGQEIDIPVILDAKKTGSSEVGSLGVTFEITGTQPTSLWNAIKEGITMTNDYIIHVAIAIKNIFAKRDVSKMGGPLMVISETVKAAGQSLPIFLFFLAIISINLAVFNLLPLPILDGGQILFYTIEAIIGRPLPLKAREYIHMGSWILILGLMVYLSTQDIYKIIKSYLS